MLNSSTVLNDLKEKVQLYVDEKMGNIEIPCNKKIKQVKACLSSKWADQNKILTFILLMLVIIILKQ